MPKISAIIHTRDDARRLGRALETLRPCDEVLVIDHDSKDGTRKIAHQYGAIVKKGITGVDDGAYAVDAKHDWIFCLLPVEALSEGLEAALFEWKSTDPGRTGGYAVAIREETAGGWKTGTKELRLVNRTCINWTGALPGNVPDAPVVAGELLRFADPE